jgi:mannose-6-phosphate isomerase-like protein (cupin superfamily)
LNWSPNPTTGTTLQDGESITVPLNSTYRLETDEASADALSAVIAGQSQVWLGSGGIEYGDQACTQSPIGAVSIIWASAPVEGCSIPNVG